MYPSKKVAERAYRGYLASKGNDKKVTLREANKK